MPIKYEKLDITEKSAGLFNASIKIIIDDFDPPYEKIITLEYRPDRPEYLETNLATQTEEFVKEIKKTERGKAVDISKSLAKVSTASGYKYNNISKVVIG